ncbi:MAG: TonB-dependent receptor, partial [Pseudomonadota bacterium]
IPMSALTQSEIDNAFARDLQDLAFVSPNMIIDDTAQGPGGVAAIFIRGIGAADVEKNFDPAVGVVADGIFLGSNAGSLLRSIDLASVEVLRGPQGTLFGRNTIGGLINITHTQPTGELGVKFRAGLEDYETYYGDAIVNFGITDNLAAKISLAKRDQQEGYYDNVTLNRDVGRNDYESYGINMVWDVTDTLALEGTYKKEETKQDTPPLLNTGQPRHLFCSSYGYCSPSLDEPITGDRLEVANQGFRPSGELSTRDNPFITAPLDAIEPIPLEATFDVDFYSLEGRWEINDAFQVDYLFGHWESNETIISNWDGTPELLFGTSRPANYDQDSNELRLTYDAGGRLSFVAGLYYWESNYDIDLRSWVTFNPNFPDTLLDVYQYSEQNTTSRAVFLKGDYELTDKWTLTLGGRYTEDEKESKQFGAVNTITPPFTDHPEEKWEEFTPRAGVRYAVNDDMMYYFTYSKGFRAGGFNGRVASVVEAREAYDPETVDSYELGIKSEWMDNRLRFNGNIFYMEYDDKQEELQLPDDGDTGQKTVVENAASATIQGVELEVQAFLGEGLSLRGNLGYLDTEYDDFSYVDINGDTIDLSGLEFRRAPDWTGSLDMTYQWEMIGGIAWVRGAYRYLGEHFVNVTNSPELENDAQNLFDASVNFSYDAFTFSLFGRNLTDEDGYIHGYDVAGLWSYAATRPPRTYGFEAVYNFGD